MINDPESCQASILPDEVTHAVGLEEPAVQVDRHHLVNATCNDVNYFNAKTFLRSLSKKISEIQMEKTKM